MIRKAIQNILPEETWKQLRKLKPWPVRIFQKCLARLGYTVARRNDYYSPLPAVPELKERVSRWNKPGSMAAISYDLPAMKLELLELLGKYYKEFSSLPAFDALKRAGYGPGYTAVDALTLYMFIRHLKPRKYIEVGSGLSTYYCSLAASKNAEEGRPLEITCIEPNPFEKLYQIPDIQVIPRQVQDVEITLFQQLELDDVLFIDSSHVVKIDGDVPYLYLEVLPTLRTGVAIHIHDVPFPYNTPYPAEHRIFEKPWPRLWTEAMIVQAFLSYNPSFQIEMCTPLLRFHEQQFLIENIPIYQPIEENPDTFSSLWIRRVA